MPVFSQGPPSPTIRAWIARVGFLQVFFTGFYKGYCDYNVSIGGLNGYMRVFGDIILLHP